MDTEEQDLFSLFWVVTGSKGHENGYIPGDCFGPILDVVALGVWMDLNLYSSSVNRSSEDLKQTVHGHTHRSDVDPSIGFTYTCSCNKITVKVV
jgi:hypothetical protein